MQSDRIDLEGDTELDEIRQPSDGASTRTNEKMDEVNDNHNQIDLSMIRGPRKDEESNGGGFWAWATVLSAFIIQSTGFGYSNAFGVYQDFYVREYLTKSTSSQISWIGSTQTFLMLTMGLFTGRLFDRGYCHHLVIIGSVVLVLSLFMLSLAQPEQYYQIFLTQGLGVGIGSSLSYVPSLAVLAQHFPTPHAQARAMGIAVAGSSLGGLLHPIMLNNLFHGHAGFARGVRASAGLIAGMQAIAVLLMRTNYPKNLRRDGLDGDDNDNDGQRKTKTGRLWPMIKKFATDRPYVCFVFGMTLFELVFFFPSFYLQLDAIEHGLDATFAFYSLSILNGVSFIGRLMPGFFARSLGVANMLVFSTASSTVLIFCMLAVRTVSGVAAFAALYGFFSGAFVTLMSPMLAILAEGPAEIGARMGMCFAITGLGSLIGTPIAGALLTSKFLWWRPILFSGVVCVAGCFLFVACRITLGRRKEAIWVI
ncbi:MFS general substrate transporter [Phellopilus nigrolimitatus]|nr:MFS general substrate transporter [Phellopilus nigrolimitatus]